jgi:hypothetical protein
MATKLQRAQALADALTNRATPQAQVVQLADALAKLDNLDPIQMTLVQKAELILEKGRQWAIGTVKRAEGDVIAASAVANNNSTIDSNFSEAS